MSSPVEFLRGLLTKHFEELEFLLSQRAIALRSTAHHLENLYELEERIDAHLDGLILGDDEAIPLLKEALAGDEPGPAGAAALVLLWLQQPEAAKLVADALKEARGPKAGAIRWALCHGPSEKLLQQLETIIASGQPAAAVAAAEALAYHKHLKASQPRLAEFAASDDPQIRTTAWRIAALL